jgi:hypothetical protein
MLNALECFWRPSGVSMTPGWKVRVRGPHHGRTTRSRHRRPGAQRRYRQLWLVGAAPE